VPSYVLFPAAPPSACAVCEHGCTCTGADVSCGHYGCYGRGPRTCPSATAAQAAYEERLRVTRAQRARLAARRTAVAGGLTFTPEYL
jgi:hypothetical protein